MIEQDESIGFKQKPCEQEGSVEDVMSYLDCVADFRKAVRHNAALKKDNDALNLCDALRDDVLPFLGVRMEDVEGK